jgi:hypothetical protein
MKPKTRRLTGADRAPAWGDVLRCPAQVGAKDGYLFTCYSDGKLLCRTPLAQMTYVRRRDGESVTVQVAD